MGKHLRPLVQAYALGFEPAPDTSVSLALEAFSSAFGCVMEITKYISDSSMNISLLSVADWKGHWGGNSNRESKI